MRMYVQLDVDWPENPKRIRAGLEASAVHALCLCLAKRSTRDGWVARTTLGLYGVTDELVERLVDVRLLDEDGEWVRPHDWLEVNLSSERIRAEKADKARAANHARWHDGRYEDCEKCAHNRRSSEPDPDGVQTDPPVSTTGSEQQPDPDTDQQQQATDPDARRALLEAAAEIIGERAAARPTSQNPTAVAAAVARGVVRDRYQDAYQWIAADPFLTADELAELLEPTEEVKPLVDPRVEAQRIQAERNHLRLLGQACAICEGIGVYLDDEGLAVRCDCQKASA